MTASWLILYLKTKNLNTICFLVVFDEFQNLLTKQVPIEGYTEWLDTIIDTCVLQVRIGLCDYREMYVTKTNCMIQSSLHYLYKSR